MTYRVQVSRATGEQSELGPYPTYEVAHEWAMGQARWIGGDAPEMRIKSDAGIVYSHPDGKPQMGAAETLAVWLQQPGALGTRRLMGTVHIINDDADDIDREHTLARREMVLMGVV